MDVDIEKGDILYVNSQKNKISNMINSFSVESINTVTDKSKEIIENRETINESKQNLMT